VAAVAAVPEQHQSLRPPGRVDQEEEAQEACRGTTLVLGT
tara:strand:+ start:709 stop:828 length:120 start_codon:yes stop_codon:yes gene_type:complete